MKHWRIEDADGVTYTTAKDRAELAARYGAEVAAAAIDARRARKAGERWCCETNRWRACGETAKREALAARAAGVTMADLLARIEALEAKVEELTK